jgi:HEPN domain-containing protein
MISIKELRKTAKAHLQDSEILFQNKRYNGSIYLCGYAVEIALKLRICKTLGWTGFPESNREFTNLTSLRTHNLDVLLQLSGKEKYIKGGHLADWSIITRWDPQVRYKSARSAKKNDAHQMISSSKNILRVLGTKV